MTIPSYVEFVDPVIEEGVDFSIDDLLNGVDFAARDRRSELAPKSEGSLAQMKPKLSNEYQFPLDSIVPEKEDSLPEIEPESPKGYVSKLAGALKNPIKSIRGLGFNPNVGDIIPGIKSLLTPLAKRDTPLLKRETERVSPAVEEKHKKAQNYTSHMDTVRSILDPLGVNDVWGTPLHKHEGLRYHALNEEKAGVPNSRLTNLETAFNSAQRFIDSPESKKHIGRKLAEIAQLRGDIDKHIEDTLPLLEMYPEHHKGKKGAREKNFKEGLEHLQNGGDHNSLVKHLMRTGALSEPTAKRYSKQIHTHMKEQLEREQKAHEAWIEDYMRNHLDLPVAQEIPE